MKLTLKHFNPKIPDGLKKCRRCKGLYIEKCATCEIRRGAYAEYSRKYHERKQQRRAADEDKTEP